MNKFRQICLLDLYKLRSLPSSAMAFLGVQPAPWKEIRDNESGKHHQEVQHHPEHTIINIFIMPEYKPKRFVRKPARGFWRRLFSSNPTRVEAVKKESRSEGFAPGEKIGSSPGLLGRYDQSAKDWVNPWDYPKKDQKKKNKKPMRENSGHQRAKKAEGQKDADKHRHEPKDRSQGLKAAEPRSSDNDARNAETDEKKGSHHHVKGRDNPGGRRAGIRGVKPSTSGSRRALSAL